MIKSDWFDRAARTITSQTSRRTLLKAGALTAGAAVLSACGDDPVVACPSCGQCRKYILSQATENVITELCEDDCLATTLCAAAVAEPVFNKLANYLLTSKFRVQGEAQAIHLVVDGTTVRKTVVQVFENTARDETAMLRFAADAMPQQATFALVGGDAKPGYVLYADGDTIRRLDPTTVSPSPTSTVRRSLLYPGETLDDHCKHCKRICTISTFLVCAAITTAMAANPIGLVLATAAGGAVGGLCAILGEKYLCEDLCDSLYDVQKNDSPKHCGRCDNACPPELPECCGGHCCKSCCHRPTGLCCTDGRQCCGGALCCPKGQICRGTECVPNPCWPYETTCWASTFGHHACAPPGAVCFNFPDGIPSYCVPGSYTPISCRMGGGSLPDFCCMK